MKVVVSKSELATEISKAIFVRFPPKIEVDRAVQTSLKNGPTSTVLCHVTQHLDWVAAIRIDDIYAIDKNSAQLFRSNKTKQKKTIINQKFYYWWWRHVNKVDLAKETDKGEESLSVGSLYSIHKR